MKVIGLYAGKLRPFGPRGQTSGIYKSPVDSMEVDENGCLDDVQADRRFHGGPEKALHQYALSSYEKISKHYPLLHKRIQPGIIGENIVATEMDDTNVHIGDIYRLGTTTLQVSAPRVPCWKISHKLDMQDLDKFVAKHVICGWYYRVLENGTINNGDQFELIERNNTDMSVQRLMRIHLDQTMPVEEIEAACSARGLDPEWVERFERRREVRKSDLLEQAEHDYEV